MLFIQAKQIDQLLQGETGLRQKLEAKLFILWEENNLLRKQTLASSRYIEILKKTINDTKTSGDQIQMGTEPILQSLINCT